MFFKIGRQNIKGTGEIIDGEQEFQVDDFENICVSQTDFTNTKNQRNCSIYAKIQKARGVIYNIIQS